MLLISGHLGSRRRLYLAMRLSLLLLILIGFQCSQPVHTEKTSLNGICDEKAKNLLENVYHKLGGLGRWKSIDTLSFHKTSVLYLEDGTIESKTEQQQQFIFEPYFQVFLRWEEDTVKYLHRFNGSASVKYENGRVMSRFEGTHPSILSAAYVISMPYELPKDSSLLSYEGTLLIDSTLLDAIKVNYKMVDEQTDTWWYFFGLDSSYWGSKVYHQPTYALIENIEMDASTGLQFPAYRRSYRVDSLNNKKFLRAEFWYTDYQIK